MREILGWISLIVIIGVIGVLALIIFPTWLVVLFTVAAAAYFAIGGDVDRT